MTEKNDNREPKTAGIPPARKGALSILQFHDHNSSEVPALIAAADEVSNYHAPVDDQAARHKALSNALALFLVAICENAPSGPERSTAISRAREAKMWASASVALEGK